MRNLAPSSPKKPALSIQRCNEVWELWTGLYMLDAWEKTLFVRSASPLRHPAQAFRFFALTAPPRPPRPAAPQNSTLIICVSVCVYYFQNWSVYR